MGVKKAYGIWFDKFISHTVEEKIANRKYFEHNANVSVKLSDGRYNFYKEVDNGKTCDRMET